VADKRISRKELLNEPDEFISFSARVIAQVQDNPRIIVMTIGLAVVIVLAVLGGYSYHHHQGTRSHELFMRALDEYSEAMRTPEQVKPEKLDELFKSFDRLATDYRSTTAGEMALLYTGHVSYAKKDYSGALDRYQRMQATKFAREGYEELVLYNVAQTKMELKDYDGATAIFKRLSQDNDSPYRREAYASIARIYELTNKQMEAVQAYRQYLKIFPEAPDAPFVKARIADLSVQG
jgi:predicted negative regulator of RcsB-dependent stress response